MPTTLEKQLKTAQKIAKVGHWELDLVANKLYWSDEVYRIFGVEPNAFAATYEAFLERIVPEDRARVDEAYTNSLKTKTNYQIRHRITTVDGLFKTVEERCEHNYNDQGEIIGSIGTVHDITDMYRLEKKVADYLELINQYVITSSTDLDGNITEVSDAFCRISKYAREELIGQNHRIIRHPDMPAKIFEEIWDAITHDKIWQGEIQNIDKEGNSYWIWMDIEPTFDEQGKKIGYTAIRQNITAQKQIEQLSITDRLTQLYNRMKLDTVLESCFAQTQSLNLQFSVILMDIDHFKSINDTFGHQAGDEVLKTFAYLLGRNLDKSITIGRWGGEEFMLIMFNYSVDDAYAYAERLRVEIEQHNFVYVGKLSASFGVAQYHKGETIGNLVKHADEALYEAKTAGRNRVKVWDLA